MENRLTLIRRLDERTADKHVVGLFQCACGNTTKVAMSRVRNGYTKSCGCINRQGEAQKTHGMRNTPEYSSWSAMRDRCLNPNSKDFHRYGGAGIGVDASFDDFDVFLSEVGPRPVGTSIDRIDNTKGYEPGNVRWATPAMQARNRHGSFDWHIKGRVFGSHGEAASHFGVSGHTVWRWVNGQMDKRRGRFIPAREDCYVVSRY